MSNLSSLLNVYWEGSCWSSLMSWGISQDDNGFTSPNASCRSFDGFSHNCPFQATMPCLISASVCGALYRLPLFRLAVIFFWYSDNCSLPCLILSPADSWSLFQKLIFARTAYSLMSCLLYLYIFHASHIVLYNRISFSVSDRPFCTPQVFLPWHPFHIVRFKHNFCCFLGLQPR